MEGFKGRKFLARKPSEKSAARLSVNTKSINQKGMEMNSSLKDKFSQWFRSNAANFVTISRLLLSSWLILAILNNKPIDLIFALVVLCAITDTLDGLLARKLKIESEIGGFLDRFADKVFICSLVIFIAWKSWPAMEIHPWLKTLTQGSALVLIFFESFIMLSGLWGAFKGLKIETNQSGKIKMTLESAAVILWFFGLVASSKGYFSMFWPLIITNLLFMVSGFFALKSAQGYLKEYNK